jgi:hypothetical protein
VGFPGFPRSIISRAQSPRFSPPSHLDACEVGFLRRFRVSSRESIPPLERWGTSSPTRSRDRRRRRWERRSRSPSFDDDSLERSESSSPSPPPPSPIPSPIFPLRREAFNFQIWSSQSPAPPVKTTAGGRTRLPRPTLQVCPLLLLPKPPCFFPTPDDGPTVVLISYCTSLDLAVVLGKKRRFVVGYEEINHWVCFSSCIS